MIPMLMLYADTAATSIPPANIGDGNMQTHTHTVLDGIEFK